MPFEPIPPDNGPPLRTFIEHVLGMPLALVRPALITLAVMVALVAVVVLVGLAWQ